MIFLSLNVLGMCIFSSQTPCVHRENTLDDTDLNPRTIVEEQQHSEAQSGGGQQNQTDVAGDHEVAHHQGHLVLVPAVLIQWRWRGIMAPAHAPLQ